jgi:predicted ATPase
MVPAMTNLPASFGGLIGRERAVSEVRTLLGSGRLVTLTGPGGVGKTRLALEVAAQAAGGYPAGTWLVELAAGTGEADVAELVPAAVGIGDSAAPGPLADRLAGALASRQLLLALDNCEHLIGPVAALAERLLQTGPGVRIMATSQEPLAIGGEQLWEVPPLAEAEATRLFAARAAAAGPGFTVDAGNARAGASICRRLDGIPLALELAAARVRALGCIRWPAGSTTGSGCLPRASGAPRRGSGRCAR